MSDIISSKMNVVEDAEDNQVPTPEQFLKHLLQEGPKYPHDERPKYKGDKNDLPDFYNEIMFKKGQEFFHKNITGVFLGCYLALFAGFSQPFAKILLMTNKSSTPMTAYKRYSATILHMCTWYDSDFEPGSKLWSSINKVRTMHRSVKKKILSNADLRLTQYEMSAVIFAFMGLPVISSEMIGIHNPSEHEINCFIHFWRVIGYLLGIKNKFNICRNSVEETKKICTLLVQRDLIPKFRAGRTEIDFEILSRAFVEGARCILPVKLSCSHIIDYLNMLVYSIEDGETFEKQTSTEKSIHEFNILSYLVWALKYTFGRFVLNQILRIAIWSLRIFPVLGYLKFKI